MKDYLQMIRWMRPSGSAALELFCEIYLEPVFVLPDEHGNYIKIIYNKDGSTPNICFTAHSDTVHYEGGVQDIEIAGDFIGVKDSDCLGADCTTGIWLILEMVKANIPGVYVIHSDEEVGCIGSQRLVASNPEWLDSLDAVISFDRRGDDSIVTHQIGTRTCSDAFARSLSGVLQAPDMKPDPSGVFTDSNEYASVVSECTNISVGYIGQHTAKETQDIRFMVELRDRLIEADWSQLVFSRTPLPDYNGYDHGFGGPDYSSLNTEQDLILDLLYDHPDEIAGYLYDLGFSARTIAEELGLGAGRTVSRYLEDEDVRAAG